MLYVQCELLSLSVTYVAINLFAVSSFGTATIDALPHPDVSWPQFLEKLRQLVSARVHNKREGQVLNTLTGQVSPWVLPEYLAPHFGRANSGGCCVIA